MQKKSALDELLQVLAKLPGLGQRSARRMALVMLKHRETILLPLIRSMKEVADTIHACSECGNWDTSDPCSICTDSRRDTKLMCVIEDVADLWALERGGVYRGLYHILGGTLSALDGRGPDSLNIPKLLERIKKGEVEEVIMATNATMDGQTTAHYVAEQLKDLGVRISRPAYGIPLGGELDYLDEGTLLAALKSRQAI